MANPVNMPPLGESVTEGTVTRWLKQVGDRVEQDEPLVEIATDKVDTEIPSPVAGTLLEITVPEDETAEVGAQLAVIGEESEAGASGGGDAGGPDAGAEEAATPEVRPEENQDSGGRGRRPARRGPRPRRGPPTTRPTARSSSPCRWSRPTSPPRRRAPRPTRPPPSRPPTPSRAAAAPRSSCPRSASP